MADRNLSLALRLYADSANFVRGLAGGQQGVKRFTAVAKQEFDALRNTMRSVQGQIDPHMYCQAGIDCRPTGREYRSRYWKPVG